MIVASFQAITFCQNTDISIHFFPTSPEFHIPKLLKEMKGRTFIRFKGVHYSDK